MVIFVRLHAAAASTGAQQLSLKLVKSDFPQPLPLIVLTGRQMDVIAASFKQFEPLAEHLAPAFYNRLFELEPQLRLLFSADPSDQIRELVTLLKITVTSVRHLEDLEPMLRLLGSEHKSRGLNPEYYDIIGDVLLWTLEQGLAEAYTEEVNEAWATLYGILCESIMCTRARQSTDQKSSESNFA